MGIIVSTPSGWGTQGGNGHEALAGANVSLGKDWSPLPVPGAQLEQVDLKLWKTEVWGKCL